jgi:integrase/recombinase XerC
MKPPDETSAIALPAAVPEASQELQRPSPTTPASSAGADPGPGKRKNYKIPPDQVLGRPAVPITEASPNVAGEELHGRGDDDVGTGGPARRRDPELARLVDAYVESRITLNTRLAYELALQDFLRALKIEDAGELLAVRADQVVRYRNALEKRGLAPSTINQRLAAVRGLYRRMLKEGRIQHNPADPELVEGLQVSDVSRTEGLTVDEVGQVLATCDGTLRGLRDRALVLTLFYQGLRRSEASKLCYRDITTRRGLLEVKGAKNNPYDTIRLKPEVKRAIEDYLEVLGRELRRRETRPEDPVFVSVSIRSFGRRLAPSSINNLVKARVKLAGITRRATCHSFRHACTTAALAAGVPLHQVQRHLRHKDVRTTLRYDREREARKNPTLEMMPDVE